MKTQRSCPDCGSPLPPDAPEGLCPECLMKCGLKLQQKMTISVQPIETTGDPDLPNPGDQFGDYRIECELGRGGMGAVYEAEQLETGRRVALKVLAHKLHSADARARFFREGRLAASINHPNSVYVYGTGEIEGTPVIVMELINGSTLEERVKKDGPLPVGEAVDAIVDVISGLQAAQATGILHRDIKPANCFEDADGTVKVGDFGLSISTEARDETNLTQEGMFLGTPIFSSPEQLRGEELNVRSDIYSVGGTLFYLLTGRTPFEGKTMVQILATVLNAAPPSPREFRKDIPERLAKLVLRCLEKTPGERFADYEELRRALVPFGSEAPVPAPLPIRLLAGGVDCLMLVLFSSLLMLAGILMGLYTFRDIARPPGAWSQNPVPFLFQMIPNLLPFAYYLVMESRWGFTIGKAVCGLRVVDANRNPPGFWKAFRRMAVYVVIPALPGWILIALAVMGTTIDGQNVGQSRVLTMAILWTGWLFLALLFASVRQRNGLAALQDLASGTRVTRKPHLKARPSMAAVDLEPVTETQSKSRIGSYHVLETLGKSANDEWVLAYDARLLRKVWIHVVALGAPEVPKHLRALGRPGRLRWIAGRRSEGENWDVYEAPDGMSLLHQIEEPQPWELVRFWMLDLAQELAASERDGSPPSVLSLNRVWVSTEGRAKLLDAPVPGGEASGEAFEDAGSFLTKVAAASLEGNAEMPKDEAIKVAIPLHVRRFLEALRESTQPETMAAELKGLIHKPARVTRARRAGLVAGCLAVPLVWFVSFSFLIEAGALDAVTSPGFQEGIQSGRPELFLPDTAAGVEASFEDVDSFGTWVNDINELFHHLRILQRSDQRARDFFERAGLQQEESKEAANRDRLLGIFISKRYRTFVEDTDRWNGPYAMDRVEHQVRLFVEASLRDYPNPTEEEFAEAEAAFEPILAKKRERDEDFLEALNRWMPLGAAGGFLLLCVAVPAILAALCFRGGLLLLSLGLVVVRKDGRRASRARVLWRSLVTWLPLIILLILLSLVAVKTGSVAWVYVTTVGMIIYSFLMVIPERSLSDRLAGTRLVLR